MGWYVEPFLANIVLAGGVLKRAGVVRSKSRRATRAESYRRISLQAALAFSEPQSTLSISPTLRRPPEYADGEHYVLSGKKGHGR